MGKIFRRLSGHSPGLLPIPTWAISRRVLNGMAPSPPGPLAEAKALAKGKTSVDCMLYGRSLRFRGME